MKICFGVITLLLAISCTKQNTGLHETVAQSQDNSVAAHHIGERYGGGIIFYIDSTGQHGLIADTVDLGVALWWPKTTTYIRVGTGARIGHGKLNTRKIILTQGDSGRYAARLCKKSNRGGYDDWFLPSKDELDSLYHKRFRVGGFVNNGYWSSSEDDLTNAFFQTFNNTHNAMFSWNKKTKQGVRAIREF